MYSFWLDLDKTIWNCYDRTGVEVWAKELDGPFNISEDSPDRVIASNGVCELQSGVREFFLKTKNEAHSINTISAGADFVNKFEDQPSYLLLKLLGLLEYQDNIVLQTRELNKGRFLSKLNNKNIVFIDDDPLQIRSSNDYNVFSINRGSFTLWSTLVFP
tara:strand:+ start:3495 stop:3974 length:480 start_codon:yes stop_codon:yes gene_type:complete